MKSWKLGAIFGFIFGLVAPTLLLLLGGVRNEGGTTGGGTLIAMAYVLIQIIAPFLFMIIGALLSYVVERLLKKRELWLSTGVFFMFLVPLICLALTGDYNLFSFFYFMLIYPWAFIMGAVIGYIIENRKNLHKIKGWKLGVIYGFLLSLVIYGLIILMEFLGVINERSTLISFQSYPQTNIESMLWPCIILFFMLSPVLFPIIGAIIGYIFEKIKK